MSKRKNDEKSELYALYFYFFIILLVPFSFLIILLYKYFFITGGCLIALATIHLIIVVKKRRTLDAIIKSCKKIDIKITKECYKTFIKSYKNIEYQLNDKSFFGTHVSSIKFKENSFWAEHNQYWLFFSQLKEVNIFLGKKCNLIIKLYVDNYISTLEQQTLSCSYKYRNNAKELYRVLKTIIEINKCYGKDLTAETKWQSEYLLKEICENLFGKDNVLFHYRPEFLKIGKSQLSYDVFIKSKNIAIEYQGKQHFEPVDFFGGERNFKDNQKRDLQKKELSEINGVKLIYVNYWEDLNVDLIKQKILF